MKHLKIKEKEKRQKLKEASQTGDNKKLSKAEAEQNLKKLAKGGRATILKVSFLPHFQYKLVLYLSLPVARGYSFKHLCGSPSLDTAGDAVPNLLF